ncbi:hypothetical protein [Parasedimentitalea psychrophila]|uniref:DUF3108 domain-containing protein n=1 Tax=Parasedimentitalea psychrophila TaxID=2997337 RepID=A0A9Y2L481_9RHOB|nr:hypothetical protein [Parasedimentitalea psychrophila]WIY27112.1 hypothetical protein QPJ95_09480 [Parasedimentitalea psychrophila]
MSFKNIIAVIALLGLAPAAQSQEPSLSFNLFSYQGAYLNRIFRFNADYTAKYNIPIKVPFALQIPIRNDVELIADGRPSGGIVKFTFATKDPSGRRFIENFHVVDASFPIPQDSDDPMPIRLRSAAKALTQSAYPSAIQGFTDAKIISTREISVNGMRAVQLLATYTDPSNGPMVLQLVAIPHPARAESYFILHNISRNLVPINGPEQLPDTLGGRILASFSYE